jgi:hypothetical protein
MHRLTVKRLAVDQATGIQPIVRIVLDHLTAKHATKDLVKRQVIRLRLFVGVVCDSDSVVCDRGNDLGNIHVRLPDAHDLPWQLVYVKRVPQVKHGSLCFDSKVLELYDHDGVLLPNHLDQYPLSSPPIELAVEDLLPRAEVEAAVRDRYYDLAAHDLAFQVRVGVVFSRSVVPVVADGLVWG